jgi:hypothetical protein
MLKIVILKNELCHKVFEIHYHNTENDENTKIIRLNNPSKVAFIW